jgi:hypothetical protein
VVAEVDLVVADTTIKVRPVGVDLGVVVLEIHPVKVV